MEPPLCRVWSRLEEEGGGCSEEDGWEGMRERMNKGGRRARKKEREEVRGITGKRGGRRVEGGDEVVGVRGRDEGGEGVGGMRAPGAAGTKRYNVSIFCNLLSQCSQTMLENSNSKVCTTYDVQVFWQ